VNQSTSTNVGVDGNILVGSPIPASVIKYNSSTFV